MSTTTKNYSLIKPELTDAADITAMNPNWDKIDEELNGVTKNVLVNKYYVPTVNRAITGSTQTVSGNPIPTYGWVKGTNKFTNGLYEISGSVFNDNIPLAFDGDSNTNYSVNDTSSWVKFKLPSATTVKEIIVDLGTSAGDGAKGFTLQGSNNDSTWDNLVTGSGSGSAVALTTVGNYQYYKVVGTTSYLGHLQYKNVAIANYEIETYNNALTIDNTSETFEVNQRVLIETPNSMNSVAVVSNSLNGIAIDAILQPSKRYELVYTGTMFTTKEVL